MMNDDAKIYVMTLIKAGTNIQAVGRIGYVITQPIDRLDEAATERIQTLHEQFGPVDHLKQAIIEYLHHLGRVDIEIT